jgi:L-fucose isomerase-like protein
VLGDAYRRLDAIKAINVPILVVTSEFGTLSMWDWEILAWLREEGVHAIAPYDLAQARRVCAALQVKRELATGKFVVYQDDPGDGMQAPIFKRFYCWEDEFSERIMARFGLLIEKRRFKELGARAKAIPDAMAEAAWKEKQQPVAGCAGRPVTSAMKMYLALRDDLDADPAIRAMGINCLNESMFSDTTPCLAWSLLHDERGLIWGCEADTVAMLTKHILRRSTGAAVIMTNLYPFLMGQAALKHERIAEFPAVADPENHILVAHCGYMGVIPRSMSTSWTLKPKVLAIVDDNATAIDARLPEGPITMAKLMPTFDTLVATAAELTGYAGWPGSDCVNGGLIRVKDGRRMMARLPSHHALVMVGDHTADLRMIGPVFGLAVEELCA